MRWTLPLLAALAACQADSPVPTALVADAGPDQAVGLGDEVRLSGLESTGTPVDFRRWDWAFFLTPSASALTDAAFGGDNGSVHALSVQFTPDVAGDYLVGLTVSDAERTSEQDLALITVTRNDLPPTASCPVGAEGEVSALLRLDGGASADPEGADLRWDWALLAAPAESALTQAALFDTASPVAALVPDAPGTYVLALTVSDGAESDTCTVRAHVTDATASPIADAGPPPIPSSCGDHFTLDGLSSWDPAGRPLSYAWTLAAAPEGSTASPQSFSDPAAEAPTFHWDLPGEYYFTLRVTAGDQGSPPDAVRAVVADDALPTTPTADAGLDRLRNLAVPCASPTDLSTCAACASVTWTLDGSGSRDPEGDSLRYHWEIIDGEGELSSSELGYTALTLPPFALTNRAGTARSITAALTVSDCAGSHTDTVTLTAVCAQEVR